MNERRAMPNVLVARINAATNTDEARAVYDDARAAGLLDYLPGLTVVDHASMTLRALISETWASLAFEDERARKPTEAVYDTVKSHTREDIEDLRERIDIMLMRLSELIDDMDFLMRNER